VDWWSLIEAFLPRKVGVGRNALLQIVIKYTREFAYTTIRGKNETLPEASKN
jgi:hypothetical protein